MEDKILTKDGIRSIDELEKADIELKKVPKEIKEVKEIPKTVQRESIYPPLINNPTKNKIKNFNQNPNTKKLGVIAMKKTTYMGLWIFAGLVLLILLIQVIWFNISFTKKDFSTDIINNMEIPITNNYNNTNQNEHTIINNINNNITLIMPEDFLIKLVNETN